MFWLFTMVKAGKISKVKDIFSAFNKLAKNPKQLAKHLGKKTIKREVWNDFPKIKNRGIIDNDGWLMGKYVNGKLQIINKTKLAQDWDFIVKTNGEILVGRKHSWLSKGDDVLAAGELKFRNGKLVDINNASGHYLPTIEEASNFLKIFRNANVDIDNATLTILKENGEIYKQIPPNSKERILYIK